MSSFQHPNFSVASSLSKGKAKEIDFDAAFAQLSESMVSPPEQESPVIEVTTDTAKDLSKALENVTLDEKQADLSEDVPHEYVTCGNLMLRIVDSSLAYGKSF